MSALPVTFASLLLVVSTQASVIPHGWSAPFGRYLDFPSYNWGYGHGADVGFNKGVGDEYAASTARGSKSDWGNYNYGGHGDYARAASFDTGLQQDVGNAYENGWGNGWGWGAHGFQFPWGWNEHIVPHPWWWN